LKLKDIYNVCIKEGIAEDLRTPQQVKKVLSKKKSEYQKLKPSWKKFFDMESLINPYADTRILYGNPNLDIKRILIGIDINIGDLLLAKELSRGDKEIDLVMSHHPEGVAWAGLSDVMHLQTDLLKNVGIEEKIAENLMKSRINDVARRGHSSNHDRVVDAAKLLKIPFMSCHTPADNHVAKYLQEIMDKNKPKTLSRIIDLLLKEPEYREAAHKKVGPKIFHGKEKDPAGRAFVDMTGGTSGSKEVFSRFSQLGIKTLIGMHVSDAHFGKIKAEYLNIIIAGHIASDSLGMNLLLDKLLKEEDIEILECSGYRRFSRASKK